MGKRVISSLFGIPILLWAALFIYIILQGSWELTVGNHYALKITLVVFAVLGLLLLIVFSLMKKRTAARILTSSMGVK